MYIEVQHRDYLYYKLPTDVKLTPVRYSKAAMGGPKLATLRAEGSDLSLWHCLEFLRCPVIIYTDRGEAAWWGYVHEVNITARNPEIFGESRIRIGASLETMSNRIAIAYTKIDPANSILSPTRATTAWASDAISQAEYGVKELLWTKDGATDAHALAARDMKLSQVKYPVPTDPVKVEDSDSSAELVCHGWWDTMDWKYYANPTTAADDTADQVNYILTNYGQFFAAIDQEVTSGIDLTQYRDGDATAYFEASQMLEMGTTNYRRMLVEIDPKRRARIYEEPARTASFYHLTLDGEVFNFAGGLVERATCPVAFWARYRDVIPSSVDASLLADPSVKFVEEMEYDVETDRLSWTARGAPDPWEFPRTKDG